MITIDMNHVIKKYSLNPNSKGYINCPFHKEKTASLKIYDNNLGWWCYGCNRGGNPVNFIALIENIPYKEAIKEYSRELTPKEKEVYQKYKSKEKQFKEWEKQAFITFSNMFRLLDSLNILHPLSVRYLDKYEHLCNFFITASNDEKLEFYKTHYIKERELVARIYEKLNGSRISEKCN